MCYRSGVQWDDTFWDAITDEDIPQLDGAGDILFDEEENFSPIKIKLDDIEHSSKNISTEYKITGPVKDSNWCNQVYDFSIPQTGGMYSETDFESIENVENNLNNVLRGDPSFTSSVGCSSDEINCTSNRLLCDISVIVTTKELESNCKKNIVSDICIGRADDSCDIKQTIWKDTSESDICKSDCKENTNEYSTNTVPSSGISISEIVGCENVSDGIVCSEPLCYDNLLETSQFDDNLTPSSFIEYQEVEPMISSCNKRYLTSFFKIII